MSRSWLLPLILVFASCTDPGPSSEDVADVPEEPEAAAREWECVSVCFPGHPCHNLCRLTIDDPGFQIVPPPFTCDSLRPINVCGDGCCDAAETDRLDPLWCSKDCQLPKLEILKLEDKLAIIDHDQVVGSVEERYVSIAPVCR